MIYDAGDYESSGDIIADYPERPFERVCLLVGRAHGHKAGYVEVHGDHKGKRFSGRDYTGNGRGDVRVRGNEMCC